jgi:hypothetical protein
VKLDEARLRRQIDQFNRAFARNEPDPYLEELEPEVDFGSVTLTAEGRSLYGREEVRRYIEGLHEAFAEITLEAESFEAIAEGIVLTLGRWRARGRASDVMVDSPWAVATQFTSDYRMVWARAFTDEAAARAAARDRAAALGLESGAHRREATA